MVIEMAAFMDILPETVGLSLPEVLDNAGRFPHVVHRRLGRSVSENNDYLI